MTAVILAAGRSTRLYPLTAALPKCLLNVGPDTILDRIVCSVLSADVDSIVLVSGFQHTVLEEHVRRTWPSAPVVFVHNADFASTNNAASLLCARDYAIWEDMLLLDSDIVFDDALLQKLLDAPIPSCCIVRTAGLISGEDVKVATDNDKRILQIGKDVPLHKAAGESIGIQRLSPAATQVLFQTLQRRIVDERRVNEFYEASFQEMICAGIPYYAVDAGELHCIEIDTADDLAEAQKIFYPYNRR
ncbi:MAG: phosphocholine cytidylyltransferase family protein [Ignavibacteriales bacterium]|nr:phosphocholine cytidylyltransferase family protein [Ignavibacteriales bacterium]